MKTNLKLALVFLFTFTIYLSGQITITQSDYTSLTTIGNKFVSFADTLTESVNIGSPGGNNNWDFSSYPAHFTNEINYVSPAGTPYESTFSTANTVGYSELTFEDQGIIYNNKSWSYINNNDASIIGDVSIIETNNNGNKDTSTAITEHFPAFSQYDFPLEADKIWSKKDSSETVTTSSFSSFSSTTVTTYDHYVDAWGIMTLPSGKTIDALRIREKTITVSYFSGVPLPPSVSVKFFFLAKTGESFSVLAVSEDPPSSGAINGTIAWSDDDITGIEKLETIPETFSLYQNYPNPFNPGTTIQYSIPPSQQQNFILVRLKVYDILGKEVAVLVNKNQTSGDYRVKFNADNLPSGIYFLSLQAGNFNKTIKMTLLK